MRCSKGYIGAGADYSALCITHDYGKWGTMKRTLGHAACSLIGRLAISSSAEWSLSANGTPAVATSLSWNVAPTQGPIAMVHAGSPPVGWQVVLVKRNGITFCGAPRSTSAEEAQEVPTR